MANVARRAVEGWVVDAAQRFSALAHAVRAQLLREVSDPKPQSSSSEQSAIERLCSTLETLLCHLPSCDARWARYALTRGIREKLGSVIEQLVETQNLGATGEIDLSALRSACDACGEFGELLSSVEEEVSHINVLHVTGMDAGALADENALARGASGFGLEDELSGDESHGDSGIFNFGDLPPFDKLSGLLAAITKEEGALHAWRQMAAFSAADLLHSDQWEDIPPALSDALGRAQMPLSRMRTEVRRIATKALARAVHVSFCACVSVCEPVHVRKIARRRLSATSAERFAADGSARAAEWAEMEEACLRLHGTLFEEAAAPQQERGPSPISPRLSLNHSRAACVGGYAHQQSECAAAHGARRRRSVCFTRTSAS
eukprot:6214723-Pleurochrysis_carterae.AAC.2